MLKRMLGNKKSSKIISAVKSNNAGAGKPTTKTTAGRSGMLGRAASKLLGGR